ncbi:MAG: GGDEF domain-containing protein [Oscillospiraceae bacterium]|jgi:diguanylate cyclase (GGDEF)-like protein|nr:GGDEF domain-containing protein [Oscillospiraceae bacterium]
MPKNVKNICVVVSDINNEYQNNIIKGVKKYANESDINVFVFSAFTGYYSNRRQDMGEYNIYNLINFEKFDGVILVTNTIINDATQDSVFGRIRALGVPAVSINYNIEDFYSIDIDNEKAMENIVEHIVLHHKCKLINYISGPYDNPDALARLKAFRKVMDKHKIRLDERRIFQGRFLSEDGPLAVKAFISSGLPMPEAVICANDEMALTAAFELERQGYSVPEDVKVTGFDNIYAARINSPKLTSVECPLFLSGYHACKKLENHYMGVQQPRTEMLSTLPIFTESCGCESEYDENADTFKRKNFKNTKMFRTGIDLINHMICDITESETYDFTIEVLKKYVLQIECEKCFICLNVDDVVAEKSPTAKIHLKDEYLVNGYTDQMQVVIAYMNGEFINLPNFRVSEMIPVSIKNDDAAMYYFSPIHYQDRSIGYCVICNSEYPLESQLYYTWLMNFGIAFENVRKLTALTNVIDELDKLYITDQLCGIYNRHGFEKFTKRLYQLCIQNHWLTMVMFMDLDGLKYINDTYGHNHGDIAIAKMASEIDRLCHNGEVCARLGGDEYVIFAADYDQNRAEFIIREIERRLAEFNETSGLPYKIGGSIGYCLEYPNIDTPIDKLIKIADDNMFENKKRRKALGLAKERGQG